MEYVNDININEVVIHVLDSYGEEPILNQFKLELDDDTYRFIYKHIEKCLKDEELQYAKFNDRRNIVNEIAQIYLNGVDNNLIELSKDIARQLFGIMKGNVNIPNCDLVVSSIITDQGPMIAILKMDYVKNFTHEIEFIDSEIGVRLIPQIAGLPGSGQKIQKAAFIKPVREKDGYNIMLLDKKKRTSEEEEYGANYWMNSFLECSIVPNDRDNTKKLINGGEVWIRKNYSDNAAEAERLRASLRKKIIEEEIININEFANEVLQEDGAADNFKVFMAGIVDEEVKVDQIYAEKKLEKVKLKIDRDIDLKISRESYEDKSKFEIQHNGDGSINMIIKNVINYLEK